MFALQKHGKYWNILLGHFIKHKPFISEECVDFVIILITTLCLTLFVTDLWTAGPFRDNSMKDRKRKIAERNGSVSIKWSEKKILSIALCPNLMDSEDITIQLVRLLHIYDVYLGSIIAKKKIQFLDTKYCISIPLHIMSKWHFIFFLKGIYSMKISNHKYIFRVYL